MGKTLDQTLPETFHPQKIEYYLRQPKNKYDQIAIISHPTHLAKLKNLGKRTLVVSCDWLLMQDVQTSGFDCVFFEFFLFDQCFEDTDVELYMKCSSWYCPDASYQTKYKPGYSLGKLFTRDASLIFIACQRLTVGLEKIIIKFNPKMIFLFDIRCEFGLLDPECKSLIALEVCRQHSVKFFDLIEAPDDDDYYWPQNHVYGYKKNTKKQRIWELRKFIYFVFSLLSKILELVTHNKKKVIFLTGGHLAKIIRDGEICSKITPFLNVISVCGSPLKLLAFLLKGGRVYYPRCAKNMPEDNLLSETFLKYQNSWITDNGQSVFTRVMRIYADKHILKIERVKSALSEYKSVIDVINRHRVQAAVLDSAINIETEAIFDTSIDTQIKKIFIWHGFWTHAVKFPALSSSTEGEHFDKVWSWGKFNERWLVKIGFKGEIKRVGNPFALKYEEIKKKNDSAKKTDNILVLQYTPMNTDIYGMNGNQYSYFVNLIRFLSHLGYNNITFKLHPGIPKLQYYEAIKSRFDLNCEIFQDGDFQDFVSDADLVVGPSNSGAFLEVLASEKPYYAVNLSPHGKSVSLNKYNISNSLSELFSNIEQRKSSNSAALNEDFFSPVECPNPLMRIYEDLQRI